MKDIHEVKDNQPLSFNHVRCRGVAARAGSVHLIYSMDRKLGRKGGARTHPQQHHPVPQGGLFSKKFPPTTGSPLECPQTMPKIQHSLVNTKRHTWTSITFHHTPTTTTQPTSCVGGASPPPHNQQAWQPLLQTDCTHHSTGYWSCFDVGIYWTFVQGNFPSPISLA